MTVEEDGVPLAGRASQRRRLALLILLAGARDRGLSRDKLMAYLWPERSTESARHALSQTLYALRQELGDDLFVAGADHLRLNSRVLSSDIADLDDAIADNDPARIVAVYQGPFLDGFFISESPEFERWAAAERERIAAAYEKALETLARSAEAAGDPRGAVEYCRRWSVHDPYNSQAALAFVRALVAAGDPAGALQHIRIHTVLLRDDLGIDPDPELLAFEEVLRQSPTRPDPTPSRAPPARVETQSVEAEPVEAETPDEAVTPMTVPPVVRQRPALGWRRHARLTLLALLVASTGALAMIQARQPTPMRAAPPVVLFASLASPDSNLALAVREALRAELESTPEIRVVNAARLEDALRLMTLPPNTRIDGRVATEAAQRLGASIVITGSVTPLGAGAQIVVQLSHASSGNVLGTVVERPPREEDLIPAVTRLANGVRERVTGSRVVSPHPLPAVTTTSLPALRNYARARQALAVNDFTSAIELAEAALVHDSMFVLAHHLLAHSLWYIDDQSHSDEHMIRAYQLGERLPPRERLIVRARYEHLIRDRPDSAIAYWKLLINSYPDEALGYDGMRWAYRALGEWSLMSAAAESAYVRDPSLLFNHLHDRIRLLVQQGDTASALALARSHQFKASWVVPEVYYELALWSVDARAARPALDRLRTDFRHFLCVLAGERAAAQEMLETRTDWVMQSLPRAYTFQARAELGPGGSTARAAELSRRVLAWIRDADLSPPAYARLAELIADIAARARDTATVADVRAFIDTKDAGRNIRSYEFARRSMESAAAFARGDMRAAAARAADAWPGVYYARSVATIVMREADALHALGEVERAAALYRLILQPNGFRDGDPEHLALHRARAARILAALPPQTAP